MNRSAARICRWLAHTAKGASERDYKRLWYRMSKPARAKWRQAWARRTRAVMTPARRALNLRAIEGLSR